MSFCPTKGLPEGKKQNTEKKNNIHIALALKTALWWPSVLVFFLGYVFFLFLRFHPEFEQVHSNIFSTGALKGADGEDAFASTRFGRLYFSRGLRSVWSAGRGQSPFQQVGDGG